MDKAKIIGVLREEEELITGVLQSRDIRRCGHPGRCAIGALLFAAGATESEVTNCTSVYTSPGSNDKEYDLGMQRLRDTYAMDLFHVEKIMQFNDSAGQRDFAEECKLNVGTEEERDRGRVCAVIKEIERM